MKANTTTHAVNIVNIVNALYYHKHYITEIEITLQEKAL